MRNIVTVLLVCGALRGVAAPTEGASWKYLLANLGPRAEGVAAGAVVAATSRKNPDYYFHWVRDAGIVFDLVAKQYRLREDGAAKDKLRERLLLFAEFSRANQKSDAPTGLGEPKFYVNGKPFTGPWGRPQHDGPAVRALALLRAAQAWFSEERRDLVAKIYDGKMPTNSVLKADLEYVGHHWEESGFDLWEEVKGQHFYTRMVQMAALRAGSKVAEKMNDEGASEFYAEQAEAIDNELDHHWEPDAGRLVATVDRDGGIDYKSGLDMSVILAVLHSPLPIDRNWGMLDERYQATMAKLVVDFRKRYDINGNGEPGVAMGRYPEDRYDGYKTGGKGNPWFLTTFAAAEYCYRLALAVSERGELKISKRNHGWWKLAGSDFDVGTVLKGKDALKAARNLTRYGDEFFARAIRHAAADGRFSEQMHRDTGYMEGAKNLTWSYAAHLTAADARAAAHSGTKDAAPVE